MAYSKFSRLLISLVVVLGNIPNAHAQGTNQYGGGGSYANVRAAFMGAGTGWNRFNVAFQTPAGNYNSAVMRKTG